MEYEEVLEAVMREYKAGNRMGRYVMAEKYGIPEGMARRVTTVIESLPTISKMYETDKELFQYTQKAKKETQRNRDINRIERKSFRDITRFDNAVSGYAEQLIDVFENNKLNISYPNHQSSEFGAIFQISDTHFNELINLEKCNVYDFKVASARMAKMVCEAKKMYNAMGVKDVLIAFTGDLLNSDRRLDELLSQATNRSKASFIAIEIIINVINDLAQDYNIHCASIVGNESRVGKDIGYVSEVVSDSYDFTIYNSVRRIMEGTGVDFIGIGDQTEQVLGFHGANILLIHGHQSQLAGKSMEAGINKLVRKYADKGININHILFGHIHECMIADLYSRSSGLPGANAYSEHGLLLTSRASQNIHIFNSDTWHSAKLDLQNATEGYKINDLLDAYNAKSADKIKDKGIFIKIDTVI